MVIGTEELIEGVIVKGPYWSEEVRIHILKPVGTRIKIIGTGIKTQKSYQAVYPKDEFLEKVEIIGGVEGPKFTANPKQFRLALEAKRIKLSYEFDPLFAVGVSKIDPLPHQIEAVYDYLLKKPRIRFLLADDPGAGKTIMAGLLLKELKYRKAIDKILIVTPPALIKQWERELSEKFGESFIKIDRSTINSFGPNIWEQHNQFLVSLDFGSRAEDVIEQLKNVNFTWGLTIVDEAHKLSAYKYGEQSVKESLRYKFGKVLSDTSEHLLFLTATPHKGDPENFRLLLNLLEKDLYANKDLIKEAIENKDNPIFLRRMKEHMRYEDGTPIFPPRRVQTIPYKLTSSEEVLYNAVTEYVQLNFEKAERLVNERVAISLALIVLQRRLASSVRAIRKSLERRLGRLTERLSVWDNPPKEKDSEILFDEEEIEDMAESDRWEVENKSLGLTTARNKDELKDEIIEVQRLVDLAKNVEREGHERKLNELRNCIDIEEIRNSNEKLLIFTEHKDTLDYLMEKVEQWGFSVTHIDGSMSMDDRKQAEDDFKDKCQIMIATEAAGEGINLQFCKLMVNYDIPWNPTRLEQRMGRIHRYGQKYEVHIYNLIAQNTREGAVLQTILDKLEQMKAHLGGDRVYDVISEIFDEEGIKFEEVMKKAILNRITLEEHQKIDKIDMNIEEKIARASEEALATKYVDLPRFKEKKELADEYRLIPEYIEQFFIEGLHNFEGRVVRIKEGLFRIEEVPVGVRKKSKDSLIQNKRYYSQVTFNKDLVEEGIEFIAPGHPLFDAVIDLILEKYGDTLSEGAIFYDPEANDESILWFVKGVINDGKGKVIGEKLFAVYQKKNNELSIKGPFIIWDLNPCDKAPKYKSLFGNLSQNEESVSDWTISNLVQPYFDEIKGQIFKDLEIKFKYIKRSLNFLINKKMEREQEYVKKEQKGKDMKLLLINTRRDIEDYKYRKESLLSEIDKEKNLSMGLPEVVAIIGLVPYPIEDDELLSKLKRDDETEKIGMEVAMDYEIKNKRTPIDVSKDNDGCGFDIKSRGNGELRYIEVKSWKKDGGAFLTNNEWIKAKRLGDKYWLYVVTNCAKDPVLMAIPNPAEKLVPDKIEKVIRWFIDSQQIKRKAEEVQK